MSVKQVFGQLLKDLVDGDDDDDGVASTPPEHIYDFPRFERDDENNGKLVRSTIKFSTYSEDDLPSDSSTEYDSYSSDEEEHQKRIYLETQQEKIRKERTVIFVVGPQGCGKTSLIQSLQSKLRSSVFQRPNHSIVQYRGGNIIGNVDKLVQEDPKKYTCIYQIRDLCSKVLNVARNNHDAPYTIIESCPMVEQDYIWIPLAKKKGHLTDIDVDIINLVQQNVTANIQNYGIYEGFKIFIYIQGDEDMFRNRLLRRKSEQDGIIKQRMNIVKSSDVKPLDRKEKEKDECSLIDLGENSTLEAIKAMHGIQSDNNETSNVDKYDYTEFPQEVVESQEPVPSKEEIREQITLFEKTFHENNSWRKKHNIIVFKTNDTSKVGDENYEKNVNIIVRRILDAQKDRIQRRLAKFRKEHGLDQLPNGIGKFSTSTIPNHTLHTNLNIGPVKVSGKRIVRSSKTNENRQYRLEGSEESYEDDESYEYDVELQKARQRDIPQEDLLESGMIPFNENVYSSDEEYLGAPKQD